MLASEIEAIRTQNEVAILSGCAECGRRVTLCHESDGKLYFARREGSVLIQRDPDSEQPLEFPLCGECVGRLVGA